MTHQEQMGTAYVHINYARYSQITCRRIWCPTCEKRQFSVGFHQGWYGWDVTCLGCGDAWQDGEMTERPFERAWRKRRIKDAKARYRRWSNHLKEQANAN